ncbi:MAG TPA: hypothetical protein VFI90_19670 [Rubrobacter sp.]|nr:hypothetical protein [Rubrobacter sp.]
MYDQRRVVRAPLALGLLVALVILALSACSGVGGQEQANKPRHLPEGSYPIALHPGEFRSEEFEPSFSFRVGKGWENNRLETSDKLGISRGGEGDPVLIFRNVQEVYKYDKTGTMQAVVKAPKDMVGWFQHHPYLDTEKPKPATVGGVKGVQFDFVVSEDFPSDDITLFRYTDGSTGDLGKEYKFRAIILKDVNGKTVTISIGAHANEFDEFLPKSQKVLDSVKWTGS